MRHRLPQLIRLFRLLKQQIPWLRLQKPYRTKYPLKVTPESKLAQLNEILATTVFVLISIFLFSPTSAAFLPWNGALEWG